MGGIMTKVELKFTERELATLRMGLGAIGILARLYPDKAHFTYEEKLADAIMGRILNAEDSFFSER